MSNNLNAPAPLQEAKNGYELLRHLCSSTNRIGFIEAVLATNAIPFTEDRFRSVPGVPGRSHGRERPTNILVDIAGKSGEETTVFLAHHDVANPASENCQDNSASVANLLDLCIRLSKFPPLSRVVIAFVDLEEKCQPQICGAQRLARKILRSELGKVRYAINLELTAQGRNYWVSTRSATTEVQGLLRGQSFHVLTTPYNDSWVLSDAGVPSVCIGSLDEKNLSDALATGSCATWSLCHKMADTFEGQAVKGDMDRFVDFLESLASLPDSRFVGDPTRQGDHPGSPVPVTSLHGNERTYNVPSPQRGLPAGGNNS